MASLDVFAAFLLTTALFAFIPGPAILYAAARTLAGGRRAGLMAALGIHIGAYVHVVAAAAGLSVLFHAVPLVYAAVKLGGAGYLIWLGLAMLRRRPADREEAPAVAPMSARRAFLQSVSVEVLNPKTAIFFTAFLPQFVDAGGGLPVAAQFALLGVVVNLMFSLADVVTVLIAGVIVASAGRSRRLGRLSERVAGSVLIGLGAHLALQK
jgi:threonine/homoserine/homoserine lactone efflux protein